MNDAETRAAALLRDSVGLGPARVVLRSCDGFMELFCDTSCFELAGEWLTVRRPEAHLHVQVRSLAGACLLNPGGDAYPHAPSLWLVGRGGQPCVIWVFGGVSRGGRCLRRVRCVTPRAPWA